MPTENQQAPSPSVNDPLTIPAVAIGASGGPGTAGSTVAPSPVYSDTTELPTKKTLADYYQEQLAAIQALFANQNPDTGAFAPGSAANQPRLVMVPQKASSAPLVLAVLVIGGIAFYLYQKHKKEE